MAGNKIGGLKAKNTIEMKYGHDFWSVTGSKGGRRTMKDGCRPKGFAADRDRAKRAGAKGGKRSKRKPVDKTNN